MDEGQHQAQQHYQARHGRTLAISFGGENDRGPRRQPPRNAGCEICWDLGLRRGLQGEKDPFLQQIEAGFHLVFCHAVPLSISCCR